MWRLVFPVIAHVLMGAHLMFHGLPALIAVPAALIALAWVPHRLIPVLQVCCLVLFGCEWGRAGVELVMTRIAWGQSWHLAACIMAAVALVTWLSCLVFRSARVKAYYGCAATPSQP